MVPNTIPVLIRRLPGNEDLPLPAYQSDRAAGMDLHAAVAEDTVIPPHGRALIPCGFSVAIPDGFEGQIRPRSGLAATSALFVLNSPGTIDSDYRGEVKVLLFNLGTEPFVVKRSMRIAQFVITPVAHATWQEVPELPLTLRDQRGFGATGH
jgi:dUTP pyrophosphatase